MYTATITSKSINHNKSTISLAIAFDNGTDTHTKTFVLPLYSLLKDVKIAVRDYITRLEAVETMMDGLPTTEIDLTNILEQTPEEEARAEWFRNFQRLQSVQKLIDMGVLTGNEAPVTNLQDKVKADLLPTYINDM